MQLQIVSHSSKAWIGLKNRRQESWGEIAPLPQRSQETLEDCLEKIKQQKRNILSFPWTFSNVLETIKTLDLPPAASFGLESALLGLLDPLDAYHVEGSALFMGSLVDIFKQADQREKEGFRSAKLKISQLSYKEATLAIHTLKDRFSLRIDVNRAWKTQESLDFFSQFPLNTFDYVEEPFENVSDLPLFTHPLGVDESFPNDLSLQDLESLPTLKALVYKPTIQGGLTYLKTLHAWTETHNLDLVLSSSFESDFGLAQIASLAHRLNLKKPLGIGTYHYLQKRHATPPLAWEGPSFIVPKQRALFSHVFPPTHTP